MHLFTHLHTTHTLHTHCTHTTQHTHTHTQQHTHTHTTQRLEVAVVRLENRCANIEKMSKKGGGASLQTKSGKNETDTHSLTN